jgi:hypothetical protein
VRDHTSRHLTDGTIDLALIKYDSEESAEARASGTGPCIHHFAIEVDDMKKSAALLNKFDCEIISDPGVIPVKFRAPGGTVGNRADGEIQEGKRSGVMEYWSTGVLGASLHYSIIPTLQSFLREIPCRCM